MTDQEIEKLAELLTQFHDMETNDSSLYGRKMDQALAADLRSALIGYGLSFELGTNKQRWAS